MMRSGPLRVLAMALSLLACVDRPAGPCRIISGDEAALARLNVGLVRYAAACHRPHDTVDEPPGAKGFAITEHRHVIIEGLCHDTCALAACQAFLERTMVRCEDPPPECGQIWRRCP